MGTDLEIFDYYYDLYIKLLTLESPNVKTYKKKPENHSTENVI